MRSISTSRSVCGALLASLLVAMQAAAVEPTHGAFTASDGVKIHYLEAGQGTPVVLIHGYTGTAQGNWFSNGVAEALAKNHHVIAIDCRGHGQSDKPHDPQMYGPRMYQDVLELMDHLKIDKAHVHGYSMGGAIVTGVLAWRPSGSSPRPTAGRACPRSTRSTRPKFRPTIPVPIRKRPKRPASCAPRPNDAEALAAVRQYPWKEGERGAIDLTKIRIPVLAINGQFDGPNAKTHRMQRELSNFRAVVLPGKSHLTAIMAGYIPPEYVSELVKFVNANDAK